MVARSYRQARLRAAGVLPAPALDMITGEAVKSPVLESGMLRYGVSIASASVDWSCASTIFETLAAAVRERRKTLKKQ